MFPGILCSDRYSGYLNTTKARRSLAGHICSATFLRPWNKRGEAAPFPLLSYNDARPWAKAIKNAVATAKMPPWSADPSVGKWKNERRLEPQEIKLLAAWADSGATAGKPLKNPPPAPAFTEGWQIGKPDSILAISVNRAIPASGKQQLGRIAEQKRLITEADRAIRGAEQRIQTLATDQERLRQNISSLNSIAGQQDVVQRYARDLAAREQQIITLRDQAAEQRTKKSALESELNGMLEKLDF